MENLYKLGLVFVIIGVVMAPFTVYFTLILAFMGFMLLGAGTKTRKITNVPYPMFMPCPACGTNMEVGKTCPACQPQPGY